MVEELQDVDPTLHLHLLANHYSKFVDLEDPEYSKDTFTVLKYYEPGQAYFECDARLSILVGLHSRRKMLAVAMQMANSKPEFKRFYRRTILLASNRRQLDRSPI